MVTGVVVALTLVVGLPAPEHPARRLAEAMALSACDVEALLEAFERELQTRPGDPALAQAAFEATYFLLQADESQLWRQPSVEARLARARRAALRTGRTDDCVSVENDFAIDLIEQHRPWEAQALALRTIARFPDAHDALPDTFWHLSRAASALGEPSAARGALEEGLARLDERLELARVQGNAPLAEYLLESRCEALAGLVHLLLELGLVDVASRHVDDLRKSAAEAQGLYPRLQAESVACMLSHAVQDHPGLLRHAREMAQYVDNESDRRTGELYELVAHVERARDDRSLLGIAEAAFERLSVDVAPGPAGSLVARLASIEGDLAMLRGDLPSARAAIERLGAVLRALALQAPDLDLRQDLMLASAQRAALQLAEGSDPVTLAVTLDELERLQGSYLDGRQRILPEAGGIGYLHWGFLRRVLSELVRLETAVGGPGSAPARALEAVLRTQSLGSFGRIVGAGPTTVAEIRGELLASGTGLLVWLPALERSHLFAIDAERFECWTLPSRDELLQVVESFADLVLVRPAADGGDLEERRAAWLERGAALLDALLPPEARATVERWSGFYASGLELCGNPFVESLPWTDGELLGARFAVSRLPSVPVGVWLARRARGAEPATPGTVVLASPRHSPVVLARWPKLEPIPMTDEDRALLTGGDGDGLFLLDDAATESDLRAACSARPALLELFTHGVYGVEADRPAGLVVSPLGANQGLLGCDAVERFEAMAPFVALYVCGSARGPTRLGDDTSAQLANAFLRPGASSVLIARGDVVYEAALELARSARAGVLRGEQPPAVALARARGELARHETWSDPYFHAPFAVYGLGLEAIAVTAAPADGAHPRDRVRTWVWAVAGAMLVLGALAGARIARR